jgi:hypothetical protein
VPSCVFVHLLLYKARTWEDCLCCHHTAALKHNRQNMCEQITDEHVFHSYVLWGESRGNDTPTTPPSLLYPEVRFSPKPNPLCFWKEKTPYSHHCWSLSPTM